eukprot:TRINITY_DN16786_c2_g1_i1.p1 TRINITY_DN16786_c2_g1~~TRINITY_DN16786_c2_g1_i1.p1  ORF type:complete len:465 (+),score=90.39 TRINITY_DN16786_c2_g1_i1:123-1397(+)
MVASRAREASSSRAASPLLLLLLLAGPSAPPGDGVVLGPLFSEALGTGEVFGPVWISNPVARHVACFADANTATECKLAGYEDHQRNLDFYILELPKGGFLYETSPNYRSDGSTPKQAPEPIGPHQLPFLVTDPLNRVIYTPPYNMWPPEGFWASFTYEVRVSEKQHDRFAAMSAPPNASEAGIAVLANPHGAIAGSNFGLADDFDGWTVTGNLADASVPGGGLKHQAFVWGQLSHYVYGVDEVMYTDFATGLDQSKWYFEAPSKFHGREMAAAYGGKLRFTTRSLYGNFTKLNDPLDWISIECASCNTGRGLRIVRFVDDTLFWFGEEKVVEVDLLPTAKWKKDPLNSALPFTFATDCEIAAALSNVTRLTILGDFARGGEGVAIDNVEIVAAHPASQPAHPYRCQQGCLCRHNPAISRPSCC